jgi:hypothetical protein
MVTLSFILITNVFFPYLIVLHTLTIHPDIISWNVTLSILRVNILHVCPSLTAILKLAFLYMLFEVCLQYILSTSLDSRTYFMVHVRSHVCTSCIERRPPSPSPGKALEIRSSPSAQKMLTYRSNSSYSTKSSELLVPSGP